VPNRPEQGLDCLSNNVLDKAKRVCRLFSITSISFLSLLSVPIFKDIRQFACDTANSPMANQKMSGDFLQLLATIFMATLVVYMKMSDKSTF
jgi:hypothetical protein